MFFKCLKIENLRAIDIRFPLICSHYINNTVIAYVYMTSVDM